MSTENYPKVFCLAGPVSCEWTCLGPMFLLLGACIKDNDKIEMTEGVWEALPDDNPMTADMLRYGQLVSCSLQTRAALSVA
jgi:hypothetical protein